jgi:hypothetical protein
VGPASEPLLDPDVSDGLATHRHGPSRRMAAAAGKGARVLAVTLPI